MKCTEARSALAELAAQKTGFNAALKKRKESGGLQRAKALRTELEKRMAELREATVSPLERKLNLKAQYEREYQVLETAGILVALPSGEKGIMGIDGRPYAIPSYAEVRKRVRNKKELLTRKAEQGVTRISLVPLPMKLDSLIARYKEALLRHYVDMPDPADPSKRIPDPLRTKLFAAKMNPLDPDVPLALDTANPVYTWEKYAGADQSGELVYDPRAFAKDAHHGKTKQELILNGRAWDIVFYEENPIIPRAGSGKTIAGRAQVEAGNDSNDYLSRIGSGQYAEEAGEGPEQWLMHALSALETTNQVLDDFQGRGSIALLLGAWFKASSGVPLAYWGRDLRQAYLLRLDPAFRSGGVGARFLVRV